MRNILVTGGSRGLGLAIASQLAAGGYHVIALARNETNLLNSARREAESNSPGSFDFVPFDLAKTEEIPGFVKTLRKKFGPIYGLVNNAGMSFEGTLALMPNSRIEQLVRLNTIAPIILSKYIVRCMLADGGGRIVNIASIIGFTGYSGLSVYAATKSSLIGFTRSLAREVGRMGVNVNAIAPGFVDTEMTQELKEEQRQQIIRRSALRRLTEIEDVAHAVEFLLGSKSKNITGTTITVDAGSTA
ncbi:MAG: SDR family oxidoreductase [Bryobacteraceae bacterium]|jgi:3-oxoacyl-[acyl-carrier protein] reductase